ncbi:MAG: hypothetical protein R3331_09295 [Sulfurospirillaceae bacterium]|nr:hypothetical protein [Sulfurospirillaceae bacterium]
MAVDTAAIGTVYDALIAKVKGTLDDQFSSGKLKGTDYANVLASGLNATIQASIKAVQDQPIQDAQVDMINAQADTEASRKLLVERQTEAFDDNLRVEEAKTLTNVTGMFGAGGTALPTDLLSKMFTAVAAITP